MILGLMVELAATAVDHFQRAQVIKVVDASDYFPAVNMAAGKRGSVAFRVVIAPNGKPISCEVTTSSNDKDFDRAACDVATHAKIYSPAVDNKGNTTFAVRNDSADFNYPEDTMVQKLVNAQIDVSVAKMPNGIADPFMMGADVLVDAAGKIEGCVFDRRRQQIYSAR